MSRFAVKAGPKVRQGQVIGYVGSTGLSTGPHLHYEVWLRGKAVNPLQLRFVGGTMLKGPALAAFQRQLAGWRTLPAAGAR
jgi:murein DD-endopeptidase MepM/ murein hydrolase activator NlpD